MSLEGIIESLIMVNFQPLKFMGLSFLLFFGLLLGLNSITYGQSNCHYIEQSTTYIDGSGIYNPGDTLCLQTGQRDYLLFKNIQGTAENPIVIKNLSGQMEIITPHFYGIKFDNCKHVKLSGKGDPTITYGLYISYVKEGAGISIDNLSTDIEIENVEISNIPIAGIYAKTEPFQGDCDNLITRDNFTMYNIKIHDCYLHDIADEGFYIGSSKYTTGQEIIADATTYPCSGNIVLPHVIEGVEIYNNIVENTGWDGIQVSSAVSGCKIYNNTIRYDSYRETDYQMSGILIGGGSNCDCYNNKIFDGKGDGIDILGLGNHKIYNNLIVRPGKTYYENESPTNYQKHGIWVGDVSTLTNSEFYIFNNTIISPRTFGIRLHDDVISSFKIYNNLIVNPGAYDIIGENSYQNISSGISFQSSNNLYKQEISEILFENSVNDDFDLKAGSPAIDAGLNLAYLGLTFDIDNRQRPYGSGFDIGAYESQSLVNSITELITDQDDEPILKKIMPNPIKLNAKINYELPKATQVKLYIMDELGRVLRTLVNEYQQKNNYQLNIDREMFGTGFYYLILETDFGRFSEKMVII